MTETAVQVTKLTEGQLDKVPKHFDEATKCLKLASMSLRTCYYDAGCSQREFCNFRDDIRDLALIFKDGLYPVSCTVVGSLKSFMDYYLSLEFKEWEDVLSDIVTEAVDYAQVLDTVTRSYTCISSDFKSREDRAGTVKQKLVLEQKAQMQQEEARLKASENSEWWGGFFQVISLGITDGGKRDEAENYRRQAIAANAEAMLCMAALESVEQNLIPAIRNFVVAMTEIAGFFRILTNDVNDFSNKGAEIADKEERKIAHFKILKSKAKRIQDSCDQFLFIAPDFVSDLQVVPMSDKPNFVQEWLAQQKHKEPHAQPLEDAWQADCFKKIAKPMLKKIERGKSDFAGSLSIFSKMIGM
jgi:hypothetical protein